MLPLALIKNNHAVPTGLGWINLGHTVRAQLNLGNLGVIAAGAAGPALQQLQTSKFLRAELEVGGAREELFWYRRAPFDIPATHSGPKWLK